MLLLASSPPHSGTRCSLQIKYAVAQDIYCYHPLYHLVKVFLSCSLSSRTISSFLILFDQLFLLSHGIHSPFYLFHFSVSPSFQKIHHFFWFHPLLVTTVVLLATFVSLIALTAFYWMWRHFTQAANYDALPNKHNWWLIYEYTHCHYYWHTIVLEATPTSYA